jgi:UDP-2,3-diacylglucosamine hydrolase
VKVFFLSDIHLRDGNGPQANRLVSFLGSEPSPGDILVLGGDIFDLLVGDKRVFRERFAPVINAIKQAAARGAAVHYLEGNHDFHFASIFTGVPNLKVHFVDFDFSAHNRRIWVSHGDLIDSSDFGYRFLRWFTKNTLFKIFVGAMPDFVIDLVGRFSSKKSREYNHAPISDLAQERIRNMYVSFARAKVRTGTDHVLVGHSHLRDQVPIKDGPHLGEYVNLGFAGDRLLYGVLEQGADKFSLKEKL